MQKRDKLKVKNFNINAGTIKERTNIISIRKFGHLINPLILKFWNEKDQLLIFYLHSLYGSFKDREKNHIDPQNNITISQFDEFVDYFLGHDYHFISPEELNSGLISNRSYAMITFDDGYYNNFLALEILQKYKIPALFFITTRNVLENRSYWWDIVFRNRIKKNSNLNLIRREQQYLKKYKHTYIDKYITQNFGTNSTAPWSDIDRPMSRAELKKFSQYPFVKIGNHTHSHSILTNYLVEDIKKEFTLSNNLIYQITGKKPTSTAFPNGNFNGSILRIAEKAGFKYAFTTLSKPNDIPICGNDINVLNRFMARPNNIRKHGSYYRMGYYPNSFADIFKNHLKFLKI